MTPSELKFDAVQHHYWVGKQRYPSVSEIIAPVCNYDGVPEDILERKSQIGSAVHTLAEWFDRKEPIDNKSIDDAVRPYFNAYKDFVKKMKPRWSLIEHRDFHPVLGYAGTLDRYGRIPGAGDGEWLVDLKTVASLQPATGLQTAGYVGIRLARTSGNPVGDPHRVIRRGALQLKPDGHWQFKEYTDPADWPTFISLKTIHSWRSKHGK